MTRQAPRFAAKMHVSDSSLVSEVMPKLVLTLKAGFQNPLTEKKNPEPKPKPKTNFKSTWYLEYSSFVQVSIMYVVEQELNFSQLQSVLSNSV